MLEDECVIPAKAKQVPLVRHAGWRKGFGLTDRRTAGGRVVSNAMPDILSAWFGISLVRPLCWPRSILEQHAHPTDAQEAFHVVLACRASKPVNPCSPPSRPIPCPSRADELAVSPCHGSAMPTPTSLAAQSGWEIRDQPGLG